MPQFTPLWNVAPPNVQRSLERLRLGTWGVGLQAPSHAWPGHILPCRRAQLQGQKCCVPEPRRHGEPRPHSARGAEERGGSFSRTPYGGRKTPGKNPQTRERGLGSQQLRTSRGTPAAELLWAGLRAPGAGIPLPPCPRRAPTVPAPGIHHPSLHAALLSLKRGAGVAWGGGRVCSETAHRTRSSAHTARSSTGLTPLFAVPVPGPGCTPRGPRRNTQSVTRLPESMARA